MTSVEVLKKPAPKVKVRVPDAGPFMVVDTDRVTVAV
jgi:hypothetical protein